MSEYTPPACAHCGEPLRERFCPDCDGGHIGWRFNSAAQDWEWQTCPTCADSGIVRVCMNLFCPGRERYTLSREDAAIWRMVERAFNKDN